jgi:hypothetical protein
MRGNLGKSIALSAMDGKLARLLELTDRVLMNLEHQIPPEATVTLELRSLVDEFRQNRGNPATQEGVGGR